MIITRSSNTRKQGDAGLGIAIGWFASHGYTVCIPLTDSQRYDLIVDDGAGLKRVSVRTTTFKANSTYAVSLRVIGSNTRGTKTRLFNKDDFELFFVVTEVGTMYFIPSVDIKLTTRLTLHKAWDRYKV